MVDEPVVVDYERVVSHDSDLSKEVSEAFGENGFGLILIRNVPDFVEKKKRLFEKTWALTRLGSDILDNELTDHKSLYNSGWSHGKEKLKGDKPDLAKGSFYFNPLTDIPGTDDDREQYPLSYPLNVWPKEKDLPGFKACAVSLGCLLHNVALALARHIDIYVAGRVKGYSSHFLYDAIKDTCKAKGRLLYYFPLEEAERENIEEDSWIGWHNDSGFLTALAGELYVDDRTGVIIDTCPDPEAGLYITRRDESVLHVTIPNDCMAVQIGECVQIITGGTLVATPHCVRGARSSNISRVANPYFIDTAPSFPLSMPAGSSREKVLSSSTNSKVSSLSKRWEKDGTTFGEFLDKTFKVYYAE